MLTADMTHNQPSNQTLGSRSHWVVGACTRGETLACNLWEKSKGGKVTWYSCYLVVTDNDIRAA